jgi:hypothetical protein
LPSAGIELILFRPARVAIAPRFDPQSASEANPLGEEAVMATVTECRGCGVSVTPSAHHCFVCKTPDPVSYRTEDYVELICPSASWSLGIAMLAGACACAGFTAFWVLWAW